jgi:selenocysteine lyase/cysteine desulfurase
VTGIVTEVDAVATLLHRHGALACFDYAAAGPYLRIEMNPEVEGAWKDAVFVSPHKFVGGPGTPGVLVAKRALFANRVPAVPGGGTITFVSPTAHSYHDDPVVREEGGTPAIVESIRAGLVFALNEAVGVDEIARGDDDFVRRALDSWGANPRIEILGNRDVERIAIVSLGVRDEEGPLHSNFVVALLNDLFGIQTRNGCFCAGPYVHRLYPIDDAWSSRMHADALRGPLGSKLSFCRVSFHWSMSEAVFRHILDAVHFVADHGRAFLPLYRFDRDTASGSTATPSTRRPRSASARGRRVRRRRSRRLPASSRRRTGCCAGSSRGRPEPSSDVEVPLHHLPGRGCSPSRLR